LSKRSSINFHSLFLSLLKWIGIPRYQKRSEAISHPNNTLYSSCVSFALPKQKSSLLWKLIFNPDNCSNMHRINFIF
jgi:hypothetical protein